MHIIVVEDDHLQAEDICPKLSEAFVGCRVELIKTEHEFRSQLDSIAAMPPSVIVLDTMLRWADPSPDMPTPPEEVLRGGDNYGGFRCGRLLAEREATKGIPVILYTVLEQIDVQPFISQLPPSTRYLRKQSNLKPLVELIRRGAPGRAGS